MKKNNWVFSDGFVSLFDDIKKSNVTVTKFSTVAWETLAFGNKVALIDRSALLIYQHSLKPDVMELCETKYKLLSYINKPYKKISFPSKFFANPSTNAKNALENLIN